ncbi:Predicted transcriptional regulators [Streptomyces sp. LaPpAH-199]|uniref:MerR family transcriptional regulator n=1 Tax=Streptomyces globisporus TaxID=1908 RepID=A0A927BMP0_STRGL|nr:MerR family transcriptional regulator [Streptomyces sp. LaPpAH-199]MBD2830550.1 MerR family transcriptional regulator [Streptomyces globisporus]MYW78200.1 MerR family transcriptional regulator [Streptomyces sp. SID8369]SDC64294.1 Predicted transcriptional regulators [Streptomyces sp. LaPpAH-199]
MDPTGELLPEAPPDGGLTTGAVARLLGVAPTTLRSWDRRYGLGPATREGGRHRRWTAADITVLRAMCRLTSEGLPPGEAARTVLAGAVSSGPAPAPAARRAPGRAPSDAARRDCRGLARAAARLDGRAMDELLAAALDRYGLPAAWDEVIMPVLHAVGRRWESAGERYIEVEHLLSWHVSGALRRVSAQPPPHAPGAGLSLLACMPGETHSLALEALAATLTRQGLPVGMFGAALPVAALVEAVRRTGPDAVVLWAQSAETASPTPVARVEAVEWGVRGARRRPAVLVAGPGWAGRRPPGARHLSGLAHAVDVLATGAAVR